MDMHGRRLQIGSLILSIVDNGMSHICNTFFIIYSPTSCRPKSNFLRILRMSRTLCSKVKSSAHKIKRRIIVPPPQLTLWNPFSTSPFDQYLSSSFKCNWKAKWASHSIPPSRCLIRHMTKRTSTRQEAHLSLHIKSSQNLSRHQLHYSPASASHLGA